MVPAKPCLWVCVYQYVTMEKDHLQVKLCTNSFAGLAGWVHLVAIFALTLVTTYLVDTNLAAGVWVGALIDVWRNQTKMRAWSHSAASSWTYWTNSNLISSSEKANKFEVQIKSFFELDLHQGLLSEVKHTMTRFSISVSLWEPISDSYLHSFSCPPIGSQWDTDTHNQSSGHYRYESNHHCCKGTH